MNDLMISIASRAVIECCCYFILQLQMRRLFYMDYTKGDMFKTDRVYHDKAFVSALTAHPFKSSDLLYRVHQFYLEIAMDNVEKKRLQLKKELEVVKKKTRKAKAFP